MESNKTYFYNLDGLRFIAAITVIFSHLETLKSYLPLYYMQNRFVAHSAQISVTFFFVLSGFLIMWWFLEETSGDVQKINIKSFYLKRIFRIWPLYFLIILLSIWFKFYNGSLFSDPLSYKRYILYVFWMPNLADIWYKNDVYLGQTWTLAVEEFFYFIFPLFLTRLNAKSLFKSICFFLISFLFLATVLNPILLKTVFYGIKINSTGRYIITFFERYRIYSFLAGSFAAVILFFRKLDFLGNNLKRLKLILLVTSFLILFLFIYGITFSFLTHQVYSILFSLLILLFTYTGYCSYLLNNKFFLLGGKVSYGIYMLHMFVIMLLINQGVFLIQFDSYLISIIVSWVLLLIFVYVLSYLSFKYFEQPIRIWAQNHYLKNGKK